MATGPTKSKDDLASLASNLTSSLQRASQAAQNATRSTIKLEKAMDGASNAMVDKASVAMSKLAEKSILVSDTLKEELKTRKHSARDLAKITNAMEATGERVVAEQKKYNEQLRRNTRYKERLLKLDQTNAKVSAALAMDNQEATNITNKFNKSIEKIVPHLTNASTNINSVVMEINRNSKALNNLANELEKPSSRIAKSLEGYQSKLIEGAKNLGTFSAVVASATVISKMLYGDSILDPADYIHAHESGWILAVRNRGDTDVHPLRECKAKCARGGGESRIVGIKGKNEIVGETL